MVLFPFRYFLAPVVLDIHERNRKAGVLRVVFCMIFYTYSLNRREGI